MDDDTHVTPSGGATETEQTDKMMMTAFGDGVSSRDRLSTGCVSPSQPRISESFCRTLYVPPCSSSPDPNTHVALQPPSPTKHFQK